MDNNDLLDIPPFLDRLTQEECGACVVTASNWKPHVYFAGKIDQNDWRHGIVPGLRNVLYEEGPLDAGPYIYNGPYFVSCDHGCHHGPTTHGVLPARAWSGEPCYQPSEYAQPDSREVARRALEGLRKSQLVFAYINALDCIGTCIEIGLAVQMRKPVAICIDAHIDELEFWFPAEFPGVTMYTGIAESDLPRILGRELAALQDRTEKCANENRVFEAIEVILREGAP